VTLAEYLDAKKAGGTDWTHKGRSDRVLYWLSTV
jgi:hypothetical protein